MLASSTGFPKGWLGARDRREVRDLETSEKCEGGMMGTNAVRFPSLLSSPLFLIINSNIPQKRHHERLGTRQVKCNV